MKRFLSIFLFVFCIFSFTFAETSVVLDQDKSLEIDLDLVVSAQLAMSSDDYMVTSGDVYTLAYAVGTSMVNYTITVDASYKIRVSNLAIIDAKGKSFLQLKKQVEDIVTKNYPMSGVQFILAQPSTFLVTVKGEVSSAKEVKAWPLSRLSSVISGSKTSYSSIREVTVTSASGVKKTYDLYKATRFGDFSQNPYVRPGDVIELKKYSRKVTIEGSVERPGTYELLEGENLTTLVEYYGNGLKPNADTTRIELLRLLDDVNVAGTMVYLDSDVIENDYQLVNYDTIKIPSFRDLKSVIFIEGAIGAVAESAADVATTNKIAVSFENGENYASLVRRYKDYFSLQADKANAYIIRGKEFISINLDEILYDKTFYSDLFVEPNDTLIVPFEQFFVTVSGAVINPGRYPYLPDRDYMYYIGLAGGFDVAKNKYDMVEIHDINGDKIKKSEEIKPESTINAKSNRFTYWFSYYSPIITSILSMITTSITLFTLGR